MIQCDTVSLKCTKKLSTSQLHESNEHALHCIVVDASEAGKGNLDVTITDPNGKPLQFELDSDDNGGYTVSYIPGMAGTHHVNVYFNREFVTGKLVGVLLHNLTVLKYKLCFCL